MLRKEQKMYKNGTLYPDMISDSKLPYMFVIPLKSMPRNRGLWKDQKAFVSATASRLERLT